LPTWPGSQAELSTAAGLVRRLLGAPFVAIQINDARAGVGWSLDDSLALPRPGEIEDFVRGRVRQEARQFDGMPAAGIQLRPAQLEPGQLPWRTPAASQRLAILNLSGKSRSDYGWLLAAVSGGPDERQEILLFAAAQWLASLAETAALENAIQLRNQFLSIASHELKTPLTSIYGVLQLQERILRLKKDEPPEQARERQESYLKMVIRQTQRLNELIDGLLDVSRIQNGRFAAEPTDTDVSLLTRETLLGRLTILAQEAGVKLVSEIPDNLHAWVDPVRMEEVVTNLAMNAIRFSPEGGIVWLKLRDQGGFLRLTVRDQGPALSAEDGERIFRPFERAQRTARFGGLGLGLFISREIAKLHGGNVVLAESVPGKGNVFEATFSQRAAA
jgi:signal transduction histidine kinase